MCGSFCTHQKVLLELKKLCDTYDVIPIVSEISAVTDTRFGSAENFLAAIEKMTGRRPLSSVEAAEPIGPKALLDVLVIAPAPATPPPS